MNDSTPIGYIHSKETFGALDGPGIRYVLFLQGCNLRCLYCHNPDTWPKGGQAITPQEVVDDIWRYKNFIRRGGVTFSGGEPLLQPEFVKAVCDLCRARGIHTAIDTAGALSFESIREAVDAADLILLDIKSIDPEMCKTLTGQDNRHALELLDYCEQTHKPVWIRQVAVPGYTLQREQLEHLRDYLKPLTCVQKTMLLPFHQLGMYKWDALRLKTPLANAPIPTEQELQDARAILGV